MFIEVSPALAAERGLENGGWATVVTARSAIEARVLVTERVPDYTIDGRPTKVVGLAVSLGREGPGAPATRSTICSSISADPNVHIQETKALTCDVRPGRRPRGPALTALVNEYRRRAGLPLEE